LLWKYFNLKKIENCHERFIYSVSFFFDNAFDYDVNCVDCKKNENLIGSCSDDGNIKLWKINFEYIC
jgi:WD40 repeat protein